VLGALGMVYMYGLGRVTWELTLDMVAVVARWLG
jgi:hypothetical protein